MYFVFHKNFKKQYKKLPQKIKDTFKKRLSLFLRDPFDSTLNNHPLSGDRNGQWSFNVTGDWRAIYVWDNKNTVILLEINTHSNLYG